MAEFAAERPVFFEGQYLGAEDLAALVRYFRTQDARQILGHHSWGIVVGLDILESEATDGSLELFIEPGLAFDGYGRIVAVLERTKLDTGLFTGGDSGEVEVWIRYAEHESGGVRKGFEVCSADDPYSRVTESFDVEVGARSSILDRQGGVVVDGETVVDAREALRQTNEDAPLLCDGSVPHQGFPEEGSGALWLIPLGIVHWQGASTTFQALSAEQKIRGRGKRRYAGTVVESVFAADGVIRLRDRFTPFDSDSEAATEETCGGERLTGADMYACSGEVNQRELVWLEGHVRITGDARLFGGSLELRDADGRDYVERTVEGVTLAKSTPLLLQRNDANERGGADLEILIGTSDDAVNRLTIGSLTVEAKPEEAADDPLCMLEYDVTAHIVVQDDGKMGIGAVDAALETPLTIRGIGEEEELLTLERSTGDRLWRINLGPTQDGLNVVEIDADASRLYLQDGGNVGIGTTEPERKLVLDDATVPPGIQFQQDGDNKSWFGQGNLGSPDMAIMDANVGIGTQTPAEALHIKGEDPDIFLDIDSSSSKQHTDLRFGSNGTQNSRIYWSKTDQKTYVESRGSEAMVFDAENVGLGTDSPAARLDVRGDIRLNDDGSLFAPGGVENLRIIVGQISSSGSITRGEGFGSMKNPLVAGRYTISFTTPFAATPIVIVSLVEHDDNVASVHDPDANGFDVHIYDCAGGNEGFQSAAFSFVALGLR